MLLMSWPATPLAVDLDHLHPDAVADARGEAALGER
jgi:hypothetical protein